MMPLSATLLCIFCQLLGIPISWKKTAVHSTIDYIGWRFNFNAGIVTIPIDKTLKLRGYIETPHLAAKNDTQVLGETNWISNVDYSTVSTLWRIWIHYWYHDLYTIPATHFSIDAGVWPRIHQLFNTEFDISYSTSGLGYTIIRQIDFCPTSNSIILGRSFLLIHIKTENRIWLRIINPNSSKRKLRPDSLRVLKLFEHWLMGVPPSRPMRAKTVLERNCFRRCMCLWFLLSNWRIYSPSFRSSILVF